MIETGELVISGIGCAIGDGEGWMALARRALADLKLPSEPLSGVIVATFSNERRFPSLAVQIAAELGLPPTTPAFDLQLACSAYPYAVYLAGKLAADTNGTVLVVDGDVQTRLVNAADKATGNIFADGVTCSLVSASATGKSSFSFLSRYDEALTCPEEGPIAMDGMKVFTFVATEVSKFLREFGTDFDWFAPHQANPYMVRQLSKSLNLENRLLTIDERLKNPGSCSVPMALAANHVKGRVLIAGFGAGYSASAGIVRVDL